MQTPILLHGGRLKLKDKRSDTYFARLTEGLVNEDTVLFVGFAKTDTAERKETYERERDFILAQTTKNLHIVDAVHENFEQQLREAKAIHISGGETPELVRKIREYPQFLELVRGKTIGGSSAGACLFSEKYWYGEENQIHTGLGVLKCGLFVHYGSEEFNAAEKEYKDFGAKIKPLATLKLEECEWVEVTI